MRIEFIRGHSILTTARYTHFSASKFATLLKLLVYAAAAPPAELLPERPVMRCSCCGAPMRIVLHRTPPAKPSKAIHASGSPPTGIGGTLSAQA